MFKLLKNPIDSMCIRIRNRKIYTIYICNQLSSSILLTHKTQVPVAYTCGAHFKMGHSKNIISYEYLKFGPFGFKCPMLKYPARI